MALKDIDIKTNPQMDKLAQVVKICIAGYPFIYAEISEPANQMGIQITLSAPKINSQEIAYTTYIISKWELADVTNKIEHITHSINIAIKELLKISGHQIVDYNDYPQMEEAYQTAVTPKFTPKYYTVPFTAKPEYDMKFTGFGAGSPATASVAPPKKPKIKEPKCVADLYDYDYGKESPKYVAKSPEYTKQAETLNKLSPAIEALNKANLDYINKDNPFLEALEKAKKEFFNQKKTIQENVIYEVDFEGNKYIKDGNHVGYKKLEMPDKAGNMQEVKHSQYAPGEGNFELMPDEIYFLDHKGSITTVPQTGVNLNQPISFEQAAKIYTGITDPFEDEDEE